jgi:hypothetical protein
VQSDPKVTSPRILPRSKGNVRRGLSFLIPGTQTLEAVGINQHVKPPAQLSFFGEPP